MPLLSATRQNTEQPSQSFNRKLKEAAEKVACDRNM